MKYGKEFQHILEASDFPDDWKDSAIEYGRLKKLIKNVVAELEGMGLSPEVLRQLLVAHQGGAAGLSGNARALRDGNTSESASGEDVFEFEFDVDDERSSPKEVHLDPVLDDGDGAGGVSGTGSSAAAAAHRFRVRMLSDSQSRDRTRSSSADSYAETSCAGSGAHAPLSVSEMLRSRSEGVGIAATDAPALSESPPVGHGRILKAAADGVTAQYVLTGPETNPVPQIRLHVSAVEMPSPSQASSASLPDVSDEPETDTDDDSDSVIELDRPEVPLSPSLMQARMAVSPIWALASAGTSLGMGELSLGEAARRDTATAHISDDEEEDDDATPTMRPVAPPAVAPSTRLPPPSPLSNGSAAPSAVMRAAHATADPLVSPESAEREFIVPLASDVAFFKVLTAALTSLSEFHAEQQQQFTADVAELCEMISGSITPGDSVTVMPTPLNAMGEGTVSKYEYRATSVSQKDLYAWRDIFALWIESEIFESSSERNRGERTVEDAERRLQNFAAEVVRRGLGDRRTIRGKRTRKAWDVFLRLNMRLLDLKRFQMANIAAARKILKKHDKRTALTASTGLAAFVRSTIQAHVDKDGNVSTWTFYNTSLPHVLLASMTDTLLPILPSLDDYACLICMSIAFKPIRLTCGHLFCVRCLVKMQERNNDSCPLCRSKTVLLADKSCLDVTLMNFMKDWFPREVKQKQRENTAEIAREQLEDAGIDTRCRIM